MHTLDELSESICALLRQILQTRQQLARLVADNPGHDADGCKAQPSAVDVAAAAARVVVEGGVGLGRAQRWRLLALLSRSAVSCAASVPATAAGLRTAQAGVAQTEAEHDSDEKEEPWREQFAPRDRRQRRH